MELKIKLSEGAAAPIKATSGSNAFDLTAKEIIRSPFGTYYEYNTGVSVEIPNGYVGLLFSRSSVTKTNMWLANAVGVIDSDYRGEIKARFYYNEDSEPYKVGDRVVQLLILPSPEVELKIVDNLETTIRGEGGFGSTG